MSRLTDLIRTLPKGWAARPIPDPVDDQLTAVVQELAGTTAAERGSSGRDDREGPVLDAYARRMATLAVRSGSTEPLRHALLSLSFASGSADYREIVTSLALVHTSARLLGSTLAECAEGLDAVAPQSFLEVITAFEARAEGDKTPDAVGYRAEGAGPDFSYVQDDAGIDLTSDRWQQFLAGAPKPPD
jgi:hypothetical protein